MFVKVTAKRQVTFPAKVLDALGVKPGDRLKIEEHAEGYVLRSRLVDATMLAPLRESCVVAEVHSTSKRFARLAMPARYGIDTSVLVRLVTGDPEAEFARCVRNLTKLVEGEGAEVFASNQVIGEAYIALQHHYGVAKAEAREALGKVLRSGLVSPLNGPAVLALIDSRSGSGLLDRLIGEDYGHRDVVTLTLDRKMAALPRSRLL